MKKREYLKRVFDEALARYGKAKTYFLLCLAVLFNFNRPIAQTIETTWDGIPLQWSLLFTALIFGYFFFQVSFDLAKNYLLPQLEITSGVDAPFVHNFQGHPPGYILGAKIPSWPMRLFRVRLKNLSGQTIREVQLRLKSIDPKPASMHPPLNLKKMHDNPSDRKSYKNSFTIPPGGDEYFDVMQLEVGQNDLSAQIEVTHIIQGVDQHIPMQNYEVTIEATGDSTPPLESTFRLMLDDPKNPVFE